MVSYNEIDVVQKVKVFDKGVDQLSAQGTEEIYTERIRYRHGDMFAPAIPQTEALKLEFEHLVDCLQNDLTPKTDGIQGLRVVRLLEWADRLATENRCWVQMPEMPSNRRPCPPRPKEIPAEK